MNPQPQAPGELYGVSYPVISELKFLASSPLLRFWDQDEPPSSYYQETEGTPEFDRRKAVGAFFTVPFLSFSHHFSYDYLNAILFARRY